MPATSITKHKRFAVRRDVVLQQDCSTTHTAMMYEISRDGCRVSGLDSRRLGDDERVTVALGEEELSGRVHWSNGSSLLIKFHSALRPSELEGLLSDSCPLTDAGMAYVLAG